ARPPVAIRLARSAARELPVPAESEDPVATLRRPVIEREISINENPGRPASPEAPAPAAVKQQILNNNNRS
ncbi:hypothetical protein, partial [Thalassobaculum sp.]|uniref:hypothetical protein n=1 Tax=Thalassobaculum sp. TaxID=2022740 RepID=UPI0032EBB5E4